MLKNYIKIALRNLWKHKLFTGLNIIGLSLSMSVCLVLILLVYDHFQYDKFHPYGDRTYRVTTSMKGANGPFDNSYASSPYLFKNHLVDNYTFVEKGINLNSTFRGEIRSPHKILNIRSLYADEDFFNVLGFELLEGQSTALLEPFSIVLSEQLAQKLFPDKDAVGQTVEFEDHGSYKVTGVAQASANNSHIDFEALASFSTLSVLHEKGKISDHFKDWGNYWENYNYLVLSEGTTPSQVESILNQLGEEKIELDDDHPGLNFELQAIENIVPGGIMNNEIKFTLPWFVLAFFGLLGLIVLITATINYTNLSIAKSLSRAKEIGIRKVNGARKGQIISQFLVESLITALLSLVAAFFIYKFLVRSFNELWIFSQIGITLTDSISAYIYFVLFTVIIGFTTGIGPSLFLSRLKAINTLKGSLSGIATRKRTIWSYIAGKRTLLSIQFSLSILMLITILVIDRQANFLVNSNYGFNESEIFYVKMQGHELPKIEQTFGSVAGVQEVAFTSHHPAVGRSHGNGAYWKEDQEPITLYHFSVSPFYLQVMELELIAGEDFPKETSTDNEKFLIINETAVETYGFESASAAIGEVMHVDDISLTIVGVVKDYHWEPLMKSIRPLGLRIQPDRYEYAYLKVSDFDQVNTKKKMEEVWKDFDESREFEGSFLNTQLDEFYQFFYDLGSILTYVALLALSITGLGFLGMVSFELKTKVKEIGIRKVLGASFQSLTFTMSKGFLIMIIITSLLSIPFALWVNGLWVNAMAFHAGMGWSIVIPAVLIIGGIVMTTILSQVWINSNKNPSETLRTE